MSVYLVDFENVTSEGLSGVDKLGEGDKVVLFYSTKANKISMSIHVEMSRSLASFEYKEVAVGGKNALDYQLSTYLGYLIGQKEDTNFYIVSRDRGYEYLRDFWKQTLGQTKEQFQLELIGAIKEVKVETNEPVVKIEENKTLESASIKEKKVILVPKEENASKNKKYEIKKSGAINKRKVMAFQKPIEPQTAIVVKENVFSNNENAKKKDNEMLEVEKQLRQLINKELQEDQIKSIVQYFKQAKNKQELHRKIVKILGQDKGTVIYHKIKKLVKNKSV